MRYVIMWALGLMLGLGPVQAAEPEMAELQVQDAWLRLPPPGAQVAAVYARLHNPGQTAVRIVGVRTDIAARAMLHVMRMEGGKMYMEAHREWVLAAGASLTLAPGGRHIMLMGLRKALAPGQRVQIQLELGDGRLVTFDALVRDARK